MSIWVWGSVAVFGALGAVTRMAVGRLCAAAFGTSFPAGTLLVNVVGCFALGWLYTWMSASPERLAAPVAQGLAVGFMGALTTFSTFGLETLRAFERQQYGVAALNIGANVVVGLAACALGIWLGQR